MFSEGRKTSTNDSVITNEIEAPRKSNDVTMKTLIPRSRYNFSLTKAVIVVLA